MKFDHPEYENTKPNLMSMIDIVFQLLVFFILTFKVVVPEGDYNVSMPLGDGAVGEMRFDQPELIRVHLHAGESGAIRSIEVDDDVEVMSLAGESVSEVFEQLNNYVDARVSPGSNPEDGVDTKVEFDIDRNLKYSYTVRAIDAVSGKQLADGNIKPLVRNFQLNYRALP